VENPDQHLICVGQFGGSYAVQGWLKLQSFTEPAEAIFDYQPWFLLAAEVEQTNRKQRGEQTSASVFVVADENVSRQKLELTSSRRHGRGFVVKLAGVDNPEQAQRLAGRSLYVSRSQLPALTDGRYYWVDLLGLAVEDQCGKPLGRVDDIMETGANDVLVVKSDAGDEVLIPYVMDHYITSVDLTARKIIVDWEGEDE